jgi:hypothetical protein
MSPGSRFIFLVVPSILLSERRRGELEGTPTSRNVRSLHGDSEQAWQRSTAAPARRLDLVPPTGTHCAAGGCRHGLQVTR